MAWDELLAKRSEDMAKAELQKMMKEMTQEQRSGVMLVVAWMLKWYNGVKAEGLHATGWKALCYMLKELVK